MKLRKPRRLLSKKANFTTPQQAKWFSLFADLLRVGFSLKQALEFCATLMPKQKEIFAQIDQRMNTGATFAQSIQLFVHRDVYYQLLIAEKHGNLQQSIAQIGRFLTLNLKQKRKLNALLQYPVILLALLGVLLIGLKALVFPELATWQDNQSPYSNNWAWLPWLLMGLGGGVCLVVLSVGYQWLKASTMNRITLLCQLPILGSVYRQYYGYYLITNFALLLQNGMGVHEICQLFAQFDSRSLLNQLGSELDQVLNTGEEPVNVVRRYPYLPQELIVFMNKGETVENLGQQLAVFANLLFDRLINQIERLLTYVQPLMSGIIAIVIVTMYLCIMLPIYQAMKGIY